MTDDFLLAPTHSCAPSPIRIPARGAVIEPGALRRIDGAQRACIARRVLRDRTGAGGLGRKPHSCDQLDRMVIAIQRSCCHFSPHCTSIRTC